MRGQYTLFSNAPTKKRKPCEYAFTRYVGQRVRDRRGEHVIAEVETYYTKYTDGTCGTPHDMSPVDPEEFKQYIDTEIEYAEHRSLSKDDTNRSMAESNLRILREIQRRGYKRK